MPIMCVRCASKKWAIKNHRFQFHLFAVCIIVNWCCSMEIQNPMSFLTVVSFWYCLSSRPVLFKPNLVRVFVCYNMLLVVVCYYAALLIVVKTNLCVLVCFFITAPLLIRCNFYVLHAYLFPLMLWKCCALFVCFFYIFVKWFSMVSRCELVKFKWHSFQTAIDCFFGR